MFYFTCIHGLTAVSSFFPFGFLHCVVYCVCTLLSAFHVELVQLIVSRSDSELEVQRYGMKKNTLTVDPIMLEGEL